MLKKLFTGGHAKAIAVILYLGGGGLWLAGVMGHQPGPVFYLAGVLLAAAYVWTLGWIWMHPGFRRSKRSPRRRYSDHLRQQHSDVVAHQYATQHPDRRKKKLRSSKRKLRWLSVAAACIVFSAVSAEFLVSFQNQIGRTEEMRLQVYLTDSDKTRTRAIATPSAGGGASKDMMLALAGVPTRELRIRNSDRVTVVNVLVRNSGDLEIENAHILISSNLPIKPAGSQLTQVSETELRAEVDDLPAFRRTGAETIFPVEITVSEARVRAGLFVTVLGEDMRPYSAAAKVMILKQSGDATPVAEQQSFAQ